MWGTVACGAVAGAAGTTGLNAATYADMAARGRPASDVPERSVEAMADRAGVAVPGEGEQRRNRVSGLGALSGLVTGVVVGTVAAVLRVDRLPAPLGAVVVGAGAMAATDLSMARLGVSDPRRWTRADWLADALPHLVYGAVTSAVLRTLTRPGSRRTR